VTRDQLKSAVLLRLGVSSSDTQMVGYINDMLNVEYLRLASEEALLEKVGTLSLVAGSPIVDLPNDWQRTIQILEAGVPLRPVTAREYADVQAAGGARRVYFPNSPDTILVAPEPTESDATGLSIIYVARPTELTTGSSVPTALPVEFHDLLVELVLMRAFLAEEDVTLAQAAQMNAQGLIERLRANQNVAGGDGIGRMLLPPIAARYGRAWR
jgi:hypothetical protein